MNGVPPKTVHPITSGTPLSCIMSFFRSCKQISYSRREARINTPILFSLSLHIYHSISLVFSLRFVEHVTASELFWGDRHMVGHFCDIIECDQRLRMDWHYVTNIHNIDYIILIWYTDTWEIIRREISRVSGTIAMPWWIMYICLMLIFLLLLPNQEQRISQIQGIDIAVDSNTTIDLRRSARFTLKPTTYSTPLISNVNFLFIPRCIKIHSLLRISHVQLFEYEKRRSAQL